MQDFETFQSTSVQTIKQCRSIQQHVYDKETWETVLIREKYSFQSGFLDHKFLSQNLINIYRWETIAFITQMKLPPMCSTFNS